MRLNEVVKDSFWIVPSLFLVAAVVLGYSLRAVDDRLATSAADTPFWVGTPGAASAILSTIATAILTFLGVVFSITLVALQLASQQFSPRVTRTFVRSTTTKVALGTFIATFVVSIIALSGVESKVEGTSTVPVASVTVSQALVGLSLVVFIVFVNSTTRLIRINYIISAVAEETRRAIALNYPPDEEYTTVEPLEPGAPAAVLESAALLPRRYRGVLLGVDAKHLVDVAAKHECVLVLTRRIGEYVPRGAPLFEVHGGRAPRELEVMRAIDLGRERTLFQDPLYGVRQLVDIAAQALSPAINAPTSAVQVIDRLTDLLPEIAERPDQSGLFADSSGRLRLVLPVTDWAGIVELAFTEIRTFGSGSPQVTRRLVSALDTLIAQVPDRRRPPLRHQRELLIAAVRARQGDEQEQQAWLESDPLGLG